MIVVLLPSKGFDAGRSRLGAGRCFRLRRGTAADPERLAEAPDRGFTVRDDNYLSARWPGDAHTFARQFVALVSGA